HGGEVAVAHGQVADLQQGAHLASAFPRGSSHACSPSPIRLNVSTSTAIATPGTATIQVELDMKSRPSESITPSDGVGGLTPMPMKLSAASSSTAMPSRIDACTITGPMVLGSTWRSTILRPEAPRARAASMYSWLEVSSVDARVTRASTGM